MGSMSVGQSSIIAENGNLAEGRLVEKKNILRYDSCRPVDEMVYDLGAINSHFIGCM